jgi:hypothetical protein
MSIAIWKPGRRLFSTAAILMILTATVHTMGMLLAKPSNPDEEKLFDTMRSVHFPMGLGMTPSMFAIYQDLSFTMSITFAALGLMNLILAASPDSSIRLLRKVAWINAAWLAAFLMLNASLGVPPSLISAVVIGLAVAGSLVGLSRAKDDRPATLARGA